MRCAFKIFLKGMRSITEELLKCGEFAKICGIPKKSLIYYDEIGLLKPYKTAENGYRYYARPQQAVVDKIKALKAIGMSLEEISLSFRNKSLDETISMIERQYELLSDKIDELEMSRKIINSASAELKQFRTVGENKLFHEYYDTIYLRGRDYDPANTEFVHSPISGAVYREDYKKGDMPEQVIRACSVGETANFIMQPGKYLSAYFRGFHIGDTIDEYLKLAAGEKISGPIYFFDVSHDFFNFSGKKYLHKISVKLG